MLRFIIISAATLSALPPALSDEFCVDITITKEYLEQLKAFKQKTDQQSPGTAISPELSVGIFYKMPEVLGPYPLTPEDPSYDQYREDLKIVLPTSSVEKKTFCLPIKKSLQTIYQVRFSGVRFAQFSKYGYQVNPCNNPDVPGPITASPFIKFTLNGCQVMGVTSVDKVTSIEKRLDTLEQTVAEMHLEMHSKFLKKKS